MPAILARAFSDKNGFVQMNTVRPNKSASRTVDILEFVAARKNACFNG